MAGERDEKELSPGDRETESGGGAVATGLADDAGAPGGMGGAEAQGGSGTGRAPGGLSPMADEQEKTDAGSPTADRH